MAGESKSFYASTAVEFISRPTDQILGELSTKVGLLHVGDERKQIQAWKVQVELLKEALRNQSSNTSCWGILIELQLLRLGRRIDTIVIIGNQIACLEFKIGNSKFNSADIDQTVDYALCLRDFHSGSLGRSISPILCCDQATIDNCDLEIEVVENVSNCLKTNAQTLSDALALIDQRTGASQIDFRKYDQSSYNPTPNIVSAARGIYAGHTVQDIGRSDANGESLQRTAQRLAQIASEARLNNEHKICFVTGEPGSGKTLLGLDLVFSGDAGRVSGEPAALLSGNRPLVAVLKEAIATDAKERESISKKEARRQAEQALQNLLGYLKEHSIAGSNPPEHVVVFDEAQRAWDAETGKKLLDRETSEPELFLEILGGLDWCCLVCLVGSGQEINRGEGGLSLWGQALHRNSSNGNKWSVHVSPQSKNGANGLTRDLGREAASELDITTENGLHLVTNLRAYRNEKQGMWVEALIDGEIELAYEIASELEGPPAIVTRELDEAKRWLLRRQRGEHRVGLLTSSGAVRLIAEGIPPSPRSNELDEVAHWFLKPAGDYRSSNALEKPLSEFVCQGLEIDYACLCWGNDLIWEGNSWIPRKMSAPKWQVSKKPDVIQHRLNAYRVLLTRSRAGLVIYVPKGDSLDLTRQPSEFDHIARALLNAGCKLI